MNLTENERRVARLLLRYMQNHPEAKHTSEGIARWWVLEQKLEEEIGTVENVIANLIDNGIITKVALPEGNAFYKIESPGVGQVFEGKINQYKSVH